MAKWKQCQERLDVLCALCHQKWDKGEVSVSLVERPIADRDGNDIRTELIDNKCPVCDKAYQKLAFIHTVLVVVA